MWSNWPKTYFTYMISFAVFHQVSYFHSLLITVDFLCQFKFMKSLTLKLFLRVSKREIFGTPHIFHAWLARVWYSKVTHFTVLDPYLSIHYLGHSLVKASQGRPAESRGGFERRRHLAGQHLGLGLQLPQGRPQDPVRNHRGCQIPRHQSNYIF